MKYYATFKVSNEIITEVISFNYITTQNYKKAVKEIREMSYNYVMSTLELGYNANDFGLNIKTVRIMFECYKIPRFIKNLFINHSRHKNRKNHAKVHSSKNTLHKKAKKRR